MARFDYTTEHGLFTATAYIWDSGRGLVELVDERRFLGHRRCLRWAKDEKHRRNTEAWAEELPRRLGEAA